MNRSQRVVASLKAQPDVTRTYELTILAGSYQQAEKQARQVCRELLAASGGPGEWVAQVLYQRKTGGIPARKVRFRFSFRAAPLVQISVDDAAFQGADGRALYEAMVRAQDLILSKRVDE